MKSKDLLNDLSIIAAKKLNNTSAFPKVWSERLDIVAACYGASEVRDDFEKWCDSVKANPPERPIAAYMNLVDSRFEDTRFSVAPEDPSVERIREHCYRSTRQIPPERFVEPLLAEFSEDEIIAAFEEYVKTRRGDQIPYAVKNFFVDGDGKIAVRTTTTVAAA